MAFYLLLLPLLLCFFRRLIESLSFRIFFIHFVDSFIHFLVKTRASQNVSVNWVKFRLDSDWNNFFVSFLLDFYFIMQLNVISCGGLKLVWCDFCGSRLRLSFNSLCRLFTCCWSCERDFELNIHVGKMQKLDSCCEVYWMSSRQGNSEIKKCQRKLKVLLKAITIQLRCRTSNSMAEHKAQQSKKGQKKRKNGKSQTREILIIIGDYACTHNLCRITREFLWFGWKKWAASVHRIIKLKN